jgi:hypothetical protein
MESPQPKIVLKEITERPPINWREVMSRSQKAFRNRWNTYITPHKKTPKTEKKDEPTKS